MTTYYDLTGFRRDILHAIAAIEEDAYGLALVDWLEEHYTEQINHSRLYQNIEYLVEAGLVNKNPIDDRTNEYELTDQGRTLLTNYADTLAATCDRLSPSPRPPGTNGGDT